MQNKQTLKKVSKISGLILIGLAFVLNPWIIEYFFSPDQELDFIWKYYAILIFDLGLFFLGLYFYYWLYKKIKETLLLIVAIFISLIIAEGIVRFAEPYFTKEYPILHDEELGWAKNFSYDSDQNLIKEDDNYFTNLDADNLVYIIGDSYAIGHDVTSYVSYIDKAFPELNIVNLGVWGYNVDQYLTMTKKYSALKNPRYIFLNFFIGNDYIPKERNDIAKDIFQATGIMENRKSKSYLLKYTMPVVNTAISKISKNKKTRNKKIIYEIENNFSRMEVAKTLETLNELIDFAKQNDIKIFIIIAPSDYQVHPDLLDQAKEYTGIVPKYFKVIEAHQSLISYLESNDLEYIDLLPIFQEKAAKKFLYLEGDNHWNDAGNILAAEAIAAKLKEINFLNNEKK